MNEGGQSDGVRECALEYRPDELAGFEASRLDLPEEDDGPLSGTLVRTIETKNERGPAVLYLHGFVDYFFQTHLARAFEEAGFRFYALDLRRYGRSLEAGNRANTARAIDDYFEEVTWALEVIHENHGALTTFIAHSTGALTAALYAKRGKRRAWIRSLAFNSPFFAFNLAPVDLRLSRMAASLANLAPNFKLPQRLPGTYGRTIHRDYEGEWQYDLLKKPLNGFPLYASWFRMIHSAQDEIKRGLGLELPVLTLASARSARRKGKPEEADFSRDIVLNVEDMKELSPQVSKKCGFAQIEGGIHDLLLSREPARSETLRRLVEFSAQVQDQE